MWDNKELSTFQLVADGEIPAASKSLFIPAGLPWDLLYVCLLNEPESKMKTKWRNKGKSTALILGSPDATCRQKAIGELILLSSAGSRQNVRYRLCRSREPSITPTATFRKPLLIGLHERLMKLSVSSREDVGDWFKPKCQAIQSQMQYLFR